MKFRKTSTASTLVTKNRLPSADGRLEVRKFVWHFGHLPVVTLVDVVAHEPRSKVLLELDQFEDLVSSAVVEERSVRLVDGILDFDLFEHIALGKSWERVSSLTWIR